MAEGDLIRRLKGYAIKRCTKVYPKGQADLDNWRAEQPAPDKWSSTVCVCVCGVCVCACVRSLACVCVRAVGVCMCVRVWRVG
jgi:hypothetical protein